MDQFEGWPAAMEDYNKQLTKLFGLPSQTASQRGYSLSVGFGNGNQGFKDSKYFLLPANQTFSHLTTYKGLFGIINSGVVRFYNLDNSNDPNELFTLKGIPKYENVAENIKPFVYTFSFCRPKTISDPAMWLEYGQVVLNFEIVNDPLGWTYHRISPMFYGESPFVPKYDKLLKDIHEKYPEWNFEPDLPSMLSLLAFHKESKHKNEEEIRLLYVPHLFQDRHEANYDFRASDIHTGITKYVELPLLVLDERKPAIVRVKKHENKRDDSLPMIKLTSIQFGDKQTHFDQGTLNKIRYELEDYLVAKFGYGIDVKENLFKMGVH